MSAHTSLRLRRLGVLVGIATLLFGSFVAPAPAGAADADELRDKQAEAARIAAQVEEQGRQVSIMAERVNEARLRASQLEGQVAESAAAVARTDAAVSQAAETLKGYVVQSYIRGGRMSQLSMLVGSGDESVSQVAVRTSYVKSLTAGERAAVDALSHARDQADARRRSLAAAEKEAKSALGKVEAERRAAAEAEAAAKATLSRVRGDMAELVAAAERRRAEESEREAAALAERQAREEAARREREARQPSAAPAPQPAPSPRPTSPPTTRRPRDDSRTGTDPGPAPAPNAGADRAVAEAKRQIGKPYEWGAEGPDSFDCSGLTMWAWRAGGVSLPHSSRAQYSSTRRVSMADIQPGDLLFYGSPIHHVGIYVGNGTMVEASETGKPVRYASIHRRDLAGIGRVTG